MSAFSTSAHSVSIRAKRVGVVICLFALCAVSISAQQFTGRVVQVDDGDTVRVLRGRETVRVRIFGIDAPESGQPYGRDARAAAVRLLLNRSVTVNVRDTDSYGRLVADVTVGGRDAGLQLVSAGAAWHYTQFSTARALADAERDARRNRRGLWAGENPMPPWEFRVEERAREAEATRPSTQAPAGLYHGNRSSKVFHAPGCPSYSCANCTATFPSIAAAEAAGYRKHADCVK